jgi:fibronectin type 3 domain-containing protein
VELTATADSGYGFANWSGDAIGTSNPVLVTMDGDKSITANFISMPTNVQASDGRYTNKVRVSWNASSGATSYKIYRSTSAAGTKTLLGSRLETNFNDKTAIPGVTYHYWVTACKGSQCSSYSASDAGWRKLIPPNNAGWQNLTPPTNVQASDGTYTNMVLVGWNASSGAKSYELYRAISAAGTKTLLGNRLGTSFNDNTAIPGITYHYWVTACKGSHCSSYSVSDTGWWNY